MRITIDNLDGLGARDYTPTIAAEGPMTIQRVLNTPTRCTAEVIVGAAGLPLPARLGRVVVEADDASVLFTGYLATEPVRVYAGESSCGSAYRARLSAVSDEWLLDRAGSGAPEESGVSLSMDGSDLLARLAARAQAGQTANIGTIPVSNARTSGVFSAQATVPWSVNAAAAASAAYAGYRVMSGQVMLQPAAAVTHSFGDADGTLSVAELQVSAVRDLANDVTISGEEEPAAYVNESFAGDGTTTAFELSESAYRDSKRTLVDDSFDDPAIDTSQWAFSDPGSHISLGAAGLVVNGGIDQDGQTTVYALDAIELGGSVLVELGGVVLGASSDGMLGAMYQGMLLLADCFAGFRVRQSTSGSGGVTIIVPVLNGVEVGTSFTPEAGHAYTLRLRLHSVEMQRIAQRYYCMADGVVLGFGSGAGIAAPLDVVFELVDEGASSNTPATVLYDSAAATGPVINSPATCVFALVNSTQIYGSIRSVEVTRPGSAWVVSTLPSGVKQTRLVGSAGEGVDCEVSYGTSAGTPGKVTFFSGRVPVVGETVTAQYRGEQRAVARLADAASVEAEAQAGAAGGINGTSRWMGKVLQPEARSSADCEAAAQTILAFATSRTAAVAGSYAVVNPADDIWPGDVLAVTSGGVTSSLLVRNVEVKDGQAVPEVRNYAIKFANDWATEWADGLGLKLSETIAADAYLPATAEAAPAQVLANLQQLSATSISGTEIQIDAGCDPPTGGGFEVRRVDWNFGADVDTADLVLRSPVRSFSIPRAAQVERYYVRMYDASSPTLYSRFSSTVFVNVPLS
ncbi:MAG TPA: hypothetical protein VHY48_02025 [Acidobacteriaceae bacterium]|nr:hypothetical protein [Acidobacteriaceae bacterium]